MPVSGTTANEAGLLLYGAPAIAKFLGLTERQVRHRVADGELPTFKIGGTVCARRATLVAWLAEREVEGQATASAFRKARREANRRAWAQRRSLQSAPSTKLSNPNVKPDNRDT
jgi:excisionase family DNA binding protein